MSRIGVSCVRDACHLPPTRSSRNLSVRVHAASEQPSVAGPTPTPEQEKQLAEAMKNPEVQKQMAEMQQAMQNPAVQQQMAEMQAAMANPELQKRLQDLQSDPEFEAMFKEIQAGGMGTLMKYWNNPDMLRKLGERMEGVNLSAAAAGAAAQTAGQPEPEVNDLLDAARLGDLEAAEDFIAVGKDVNMQDAEGRSALHYAAAHDRAAIVSELVRAGADLEICDSKQNTPLHYAAGYGRVDIVELLLDAGARVDAQNGTSKMPLQVAELNPSNPVLADADLTSRLSAVTAAE